MRKKESPTSETSSIRSPGSGSKSPQARDVPERQRRGRGATPATPIQTEHKKPQAHPQPSDPDRSVSLKQDSGSKPVLSASQNQQLPSPGSVPSAAAVLAVDKSVSGISPSCDPAPQGAGERKGSLSSDSLYSSEHQPEQNNLSPSPGSSLPSPQSRSPRKRQSADGEVLKNLPEDSPSAKVLRKLPGRLVTVVEEKEPKRRRRGESGGGGVHTEASSEETEFTQNTTHSSPDRQSQLFRENLGPPSRSPSRGQQGQEQVSPSSRSPGRSYHPYSPTHHSPDMPVLRNLPVRRRLETESRMAAQLGEHFPLGRGRGHERRTPRSPKKQEPNSPKDDGATTNATSPAHVRRKRGRPPKHQTSTREATDHTPPAQEQKSECPQSPPLSPKRKRGRPRKTSLPRLDISKSGDEEICPTSSSIPSPQGGALPVLPSECAVLTTAENSPSVSSKNTDSHHRPETDSENPITTPLFLPSAPPASSTTQSCTSHQRISSVEPNSQIVTPAAPPQDLLHPSNPVHIPLSLQTPTLSPPTHPQPVSLKAASQDSTAPIMSSQLSNDQTNDAAVELPIQTNPSEAPPKVLTVPDESSAQPSMENVTPDGSSIHVSPVKSPSTSAETSDPANTTVQPDNFTSPLVAPSNQMMQNATNSDQSKVQPVETVLTESSQMLTSQSPESHNTRTELTQSLQGVYQNETSIQCPAEPHETDNNAESRASTHSRMESVEEMEVKDSAALEPLEKNSSLSQRKRRKMDDFQEDKIPSEGGTGLETEVPTTSESDRAEKSVVEESVTEELKRKSKCRKQSISRQTSQESVCSSSPSSVSSCNTRSSWSRKATERFVPAKRKRVERNSNEATVDRESDQEPASDSDSEDSAVRERRLTRSSQKEQNQSECEQDKHKRGRGKSGRKPSAEEQNAGATPVRITRKSLQSSALTSPEPEVLNKRCSALNAAAKLLAMRGRGPDSPSSSTKGKVAQEQVSSVKNIKPKTSKTEVDSRTSSCEKQSSSGLLDSPPPLGIGHSPARSNRQRSRNLHTPVEEAKKMKSEERRREVEEEKKEQRSGGHSVCSSVSSERGAGSSRSSSSSSQRTRSLSSRSTGPPRRRSRAPSSGSDTERHTPTAKKSTQSRGRHSRKGRHSHKHDKPELSAGSSEGTPDRVLRSVAALAEAQARPPSGNTRSSASQHRQTKT